MVPPRRARIGPAALAASAVLALLLSGCGFGMPPGGTTQGQDISSLYHLLFWTAIPVGGTVYGLMLWSLLRYRQRKDDDGSLPKQTRYHVPLEITYTAIPILIVIFLFVMTFRTETRVDAVSADPAVRIHVTAFRWQWRFDFVDHGFSVVGTVGTPSSGPIVELPTGEPVRVTLNAADVDHSFFVPAFNFKRDAIPNITNTFDLTIPRQGVFRGECAELCGVGHPDMTFFIRAVDPAAFQQWLTSNEGRGVVVSSSTG
jgi:cytochrome c oxidase subunit 2